MLLTTQPLDRPLTRLLCADRPQERLLRLGASALSDVELLAILLRSGTRRADVVAVSSALLNEAGSLAAFARWNQDDFLRFPGIGPVKAMQLCSLLELSRRLQKAESPAPTRVKTPEDIAHILKTEAETLNVEKFWVLCLNAKNNLIRVSATSSGTATSSLAHPREVFREAIRCAATTLAVAHNHPSGDPAPSSADIQVTRQLREAAKVVGIELIDHVIIGRVRSDPLGRGWYSFRQAGLL